MAVVAAVATAYIPEDGKIAVQVLYFAQVRESAGISNEEFILASPATLNDLFLKVTGTHPEIAKLKRIIQTSLNHKIVKGRTVLKDGDEVAFMPPVMGG